MLRTIAATLALALPFTGLLGGEVYRHREDRSLTPAEEYLFEKCGEVLWDSDFPQLFEIALVGRHIAEPKLVLAGGPVYVPPKDPAREALLKRYSVAQSPDIQAMILFYLPLVDEERSAENLVVKAFKGSPSPKVRGAALSYLISTRPTHEAPYEGFAEEAMNWIMGEKDKVDMTCLVRFLEYWFKENRAVRKILEDMNAAERGILLQRLAEFLATPSSSGVDDVLGAIRATGFEGIGRLVLSHAEGLSQAETMSAQNDEFVRLLLCRQDRGAGVVSEDDWATPVGLRLLRRGIVGREEHAARIAEKVYVGVLSRRIPKEEINADILRLKASAIVLVPKRVGLRIIVDLNRIPEAAVKYLNSSLSFTKSDIEFLRENGLSEKVLDHLEGLMKR